MRTPFTALLLCLIAVSSAAAADLDYSKASIEKLIDDLTLIDAEAPGLESSAFSTGFIGDDSPQQALAGLVGAPRPVAALQMRELVRRGPTALPALIKHLNDKRPTKLRVGMPPAKAGEIGFDFFGGQIFGKEYTPRDLRNNTRVCRGFRECNEKSFSGTYTVRVGDIAFSLIGQIVNRELHAVRYQPTAILIVNSPVQTPELATQVRRDWSGIGNEGLKNALLSDLRGDYEGLYSSALARLRIYYLETYNSFTGIDLKKRLAFERERQQEIDDAMAIAALPPDQPLIGGGEITYDEALANCETLEKCLDAIDNAFHKRISLYLGKTSTAAAHLERFGEPAKQALLQRITDPSVGWRFAAGELLGQWSALSEKDIQPVLDASRMQTGNAASDALAKIGSPEAIRVLVRRISVYGDTDNTSDSLAQLGARALPYLLLVLADDNRWMDAASIIDKMGDKSSSGAEAWAVIATDPKQPYGERLAALRGLSAMGPRARDTGDRIAGLLDRGDNKLRGAANDALSKMQYPAVIGREVRECSTQSDPFASSRGPSGGCLGQIAAHGVVANQFGAIIAEKFLHATNGSDREDGATLLGYIDYDPAVPRLIELLSDPDWRVVYASARALGWLGASDAIPILNRVAQTHWLAEVRDEARLVASVMQTPERRLPRRSLDETSSEDDVFAPNPTISTPRTFCASGMWSWEGRDFQQPKTEQLSVTIEASNGNAGGQISGSHSPPNSGILVWRPASGRIQVLRNAAVRSIATSGDGAVAILGETAAFRYSSAPNNQSRYEANGLNGEAYALHATRDAKGNWGMKEIARLPLGADALTSIDTDLYAAWSGGRVVVFSLDGIQGLAPCTSDAKSP